MNKIAIVDSGIDKELHSNKVIQHLDFIKENNGEKNIHGNLCCSALLSINPDVEIYDIKILNRYNCCSINTLLEALEYIEKTDIDIINLSLASNTVGSPDEYIKLISRLSANGKIIIASLANNGTKSYPASLECVIGVDGSSFINNSTYWYNSSQEIQCIADGKPLLLKADCSRYEMFGGNSKATAIFTGIVSEYLKQNDSNDFQSIQTGLMKQAARNIWNHKKNDSPEYLVDSYNKGMLNDLICLIKNVLEIQISNDELMCGGYEYIPGLNRINTSTLIEKIEQFFGIHFDYSKIDIFWFHSIQNLYYMIDKEMNTIHEKRKL